MRSTDDLRIECIEAGLPAESRLCRICTGEVFGPEYTNAYRAKWGLGPLEEDEVKGHGPSRSSTGESRRTLPAPSKRVRSRERHDLQPSIGKNPKKGGCRGCNGRKRTSGPMPNGRGPGSKLMMLMDEAGIPHCEECITLAGKMDQWGKDGCKQRLDEIVDDILPRAREWMKDNTPNVERLLLVTGTEKIALKLAIRRKVKKAIDMVVDLPAPSVVKRSAFVGNILESTAVGPPKWTGATHPKVETIPFSGEPIRHLLYHLYPKKGNNIWQWNVEQLMAHMKLFSGRRIVAIAVDETTDELEEVKSSFSGSVVEFIVMRNCKKTGEMISFVPLLSQLCSDDPNEVVFRAHSKGVDRFEKDRKKPHLRQWAEMLYTVNLADWESVRSHLEEAAMTGACRKFDQFRKRPPRNKPSYSGTFYWFRSCFVYSRNWQAVDTERWGSESWPGRMFSREETRCLLIDDTKSMYDPHYWDKTVLPQYLQWKEDRGL